MVLVDLLFVRENVDVKRNGLASEGAHVEAIFVADCTDCFFLRGRQLGLETVDAFLVGCRPAVDVYRFDGDVVYPDRNIAHFRYHVNQLTCKCEPGYDYR